MKYKLKYIDKRSVLLTELETYPKKGILVPYEKPKKGVDSTTILEVDTDKDYRRLMAMNNAGKPSWEDVTTRTRQPREKSEE